MLPGLPLAATHGIGEDLLIRVGGAAGLIAVIALALVVPLYVTQRREVKRLLRWRELEPERGDEGAPQAYAPGVAATTATAVARPVTGGYSTGRMTPAERVTADRPALGRITAERAAIQSPSFWRRLIARGPRHPLVLALIAILIAGGAVAYVGLSSNSLSDKEPNKGNGANLDKAAVAVIILNGSSTPALADRVADDVSSDGFTNVRTGVTGESNQTVVLYDKGFKRAAKSVGENLGVEVLQPINREIQAVAPDADVVVIAGEDRAKA
jgi:hypothetical protein